MADFKTHKTAGSGAVGTSGAGGDGSGAVVAHESRTDNVHPQYLLRDEIDDVTGMSDHLADTTPHSDYLVSKSDIDDNYTNPADSTKIGTIGASKALYDKIVALEETVGIIDNTYSAYLLKPGDTLEPLKDGVNITSTFISGTSLGGGVLYIVNGNLYNSYDNLLSHPEATGTWTDITDSSEHGVACGAFGINDGKLFVVLNGSIVTPISPGGFSTGWTKVSGQSHVGYATDRTYIAGSGICNNTLYLFVVDLTLSSGILSVDTAKEIYISEIVADELTIANTYNWSYIFNTAPFLDGTGTLINEIGKPYLVNHNLNTNVIEYTEIGYAATQVVALSRTSACYIDPSGYLHHSQVYTSDSPYYLSSRYIGPLNQGLWTKLTYNTINDGDKKVFYGIYGGRLYRISTRSPYSISTYSPIDTHGFLPIVEEVIGASQLGWTTLTSTSPLYGINNGDIYKISGTSASRLTTHGSWVYLSGGTATANNLGTGTAAGLAILKNSTSSGGGSTEGMLTSADIVNEYTLDTAKIPSAELVASFHEEFLNHNHDDTYVAKAHLDYLHGENPHPQYALIGSTGSGGGIVVENPQDNQVPVYSEVTSLDSNTLRLTSDTESDLELTITNQSATGSNREWKGTSPSEFGIKSSIVNLTNDANSSSSIQKTNISEYFSEHTVTSSVDKNHPCTFFIRDGKLYSTNMARPGVQFEHSFLAEQVPNPGSGAWTAVCGYCFRKNTTLTTGERHGVGVFNNKLYKINRDNTTSLLSDVTGQWTSLVGVLGYTLVWGICDGALYLITQSGTTLVDASSLGLPDRGWTSCCSSRVLSDRFTYAVNGGRLFKVVSNSSYNGICSITEAELASSDYSTTGWHYATVATTQHKSQALHQDKNAYVLETDSVEGPFTVTLLPAPQGEPKVVGWSAVCGIGTGIYNGKLFTRSIGDPNTFVEVTIDGESSNRWTDISGEAYIPQVPGVYDSTYDQYIASVPNQELHTYPVGKCDGNCYVIKFGKAYQISGLTNNTVSSVMGLVGYSKKAPSEIAYLLPQSNAILNETSPVELVLNSKIGTYAGKWVIRKLSSTGSAILAVSTENASDIDPWATSITWSNPSVSVEAIIRSSSWIGRNVSDLVPKATSSGYGITRPKEGGGIDITEGELYISDNVVKIPIAKSNSIPIYGYTFHNHDVLIDAGLPTVPYLLLNDSLATDTDRVWYNYKANSYKPLGLLKDNILLRYHLNEDITSVAESSGSDVACNYTILNGKLFLIESADTLTQVGIDATWTTVSGFYKSLGLTRYSYAYGISNGKLYKLNDTTVTNLDSESTGWTDLCGFSSNLPSNNFYGYAIKNGALYYINNETVTAISGVTGTWVKVTGIGGKYNGKDATAYGLVLNAGATRLYALTTTATQVANSGTGWTDISGYTCGVNIAYGIRGGYLFKITPTGITSIESSTGWSRLSGVGYSAYGYSYGILNGSLYALQDTTITQVGDSELWTTITGDYAPAYSRTAYGINNGFVYILRGTVCELISRDSGWTDLLGRSDNIDMAIAIKLNEPKYSISADTDTGKWVIKNTTTSEVLATTNEEASSTDPWLCMWTNSAHITEVTSTKDWSSIPISDFLTIGVLNSRLLSFETQMTGLLSEYIRNEDLETSVDMIIADYIQSTGISDAIDTYLASTAGVTTLTNIISNSIISSLSLATTSSVNTMIANYYQNTIKSDLAGIYATKSELAAKESSITNAYTQAINVAINGLSIPDTNQLVTKEYLTLQDYASKAYVLTQINQVLTGDEELDLTGLVTTDYLEANYSTTTQMNTAIATAASAAVPIQNHSTNTTCTIKPNTLHIWNVNSTGRTLFVGISFASAGLQYGYLQVTLGASGAIECASNITLVNAFEPGKINFCTLRCVNGTYRLTVTDTY